VNGNMPRSPMPPAAVARRRTRPDLPAGPRPSHSTPSSSSSPPPVAATPHGRPGNLPLAVPRRTARPADQRLPPGRATAPARAPPRHGTLHRPVRPRRRTPRSPASATARHPHQRRRRLATSLLRRLDRLRSRLQQTPARTSGHRRRRQTRPLLKGIPRVAISDSAKTRRRGAQGTNDRADGAPRSETRQIPAPRRAGL
jgi:hypothetical protein